MTDGAIRVDLPARLRHAARWQVSTGGARGGPGAELSSPPGSREVCLSGAGQLYGRAFQVRLTLTVPVEAGRTTAIRFPIDP